MLAAPMSRIGHIAATTVADVRFRHKIEKLHARGPRAVAEVLAEIGAERSIGTVVDQTLDRHLAVPEEALEATGGDRLPPAPLYAVNNTNEPGNTAA